MIGLRDGMDRRCSACSKLKHTLWRKVWYPADRFLESAIACGIRKVEPRCDEVIHLCSVGCSFMCLFCAKRVLVSGSMPVC